MPDSPDTALMAVLTTVPDADVAERLATRLVEERLAACSNLVPGVTSIFRWNGQVQRETEVLVILKTTQAAFPQLRARIIELHPYDVPEVLVIPTPDGSTAYMDWVRGEVSVSP